MIAFTTPRFFVFLCCACLALMPGFVGAEPITLTALAITAGVSLLCSIAKASRGMGSRRGRNLELSQKTQKTNPHRGGRLLMKRGLPKEAPKDTFLEVDSEGKALLAKMRFALKLMVEYRMFVQAYVEDYKKNKGQVLSDDDKEFVATITALGDTNKPAGKMVEKGLEQLEELKGEEVDTAIEQGEEDARKAEKDLNEGQKKDLADFKEALTNWVAPVVEAAAS